MALQEHPVNGAPVTCTDPQRMVFSPSLTEAEKFPVVEYVAVTVFPSEPHLPLEDAGVAPFNVQSQVELLTKFRYSIISVTEPPLSDAGVNTQFTVSPL